MPSDSMQQIGKRKYLVVNLRRKDSFEPGFIVRSRLVLAQLHLGDETGRNYEALDQHGGGVLFVQERIPSKPIDAMAKDFMNMQLLSFVFRNHDNVLRIL